MGTTADVRIDGAADPRAALDAAFAALDRVDASMSLYHDSELVRLNSDGDIAASEDLWSVLTVALDVARASGGAFDPTVEPLLRAAGSYGGRRRLVTEAELGRLMPRVGFRHIEREPAARRVLLRGGARLDLGGIAKGYAADLALAALRSHGARSGIVDLGRSSIGAFGAPVYLDVGRDRRDARPWAVLRVGDASVSTSAAAERPGHIIDPRTGRPARGVLSATVIARTGIEADALSTAAFVLGARDGLALLRERGAEGMVLEIRDGRRVIHSTPGLQERHLARRAPDVEFVR